MAFPSDSSTPFRFDKVESTNLTAKGWRVRALLKVPAVVALSQWVVEDEENVSGFASWGLYLSALLSRGISNALLILH